MEMKFLSANPLLPNKTHLSLFHLRPQTPLQSLKHSPSHLKPPPSHLKKTPPISITNPTTTTTTTTIKSPPPPLSNWPHFAKRVSGEWDGFCAEFTPSGSPIELPENVVPEAFREWEVQLFDWQTQCPTLAKPECPNWSYKLIKLLPTVGCEADAATRYTVEERIVGGAENMVLGFGYGGDGCYVGVWEVGGRGLELEHCLVREEDGEVRVRVVMVVKVEEEGGLRLERIRVFSESWDGPWRNGEQLGGCAIRESGFALGEKVAVGNVVGDWEGRRLGVARVGSDKKVRFLSF